MVLYVLYLVRQSGLHPNVFATRMLKLDTISWRPFNKMFRISKTLRLATNCHVCLPDEKTLGCHQTWLENPRWNGGNWENHRWTLAMFQPEAYRPTIWTSAVLFPDQGPMGYVDAWRNKSGDPSAVAAFHVKKGRSERPFPARSRRGVGLGGPWWQNSEARKVECHRVDLFDGHLF